MVGDSSEAVGGCSGNESPAGVRVSPREEATAVGGFRGITMVNTDPRPTSESMSSLPLCAATIVSTILSPSPVPEASF